MTARTQLIFQDNPGSLPATYRVPASLEVIVSSVFARFDGTGASGDFVPALDLLSQNGNLIARVAVTQTLVVGDDARVTWAPFLRRQPNLTPGAGIIPASAGINATVAQNLANNTLTTLNWDYENWDNAGMVDLIAHPTEIRCAVDGYYQASAYVSWAANAVGIREVRIQTVGAITGTRFVLDTRPGGGDGANNEYHNISHGFLCKAGDIFTMQAKQTSGGALNVAQFVTAFEVIGYGPLGTGPGIP